MLDFSNEQAAVELNGPRKAVVSKVEEKTSESGLDYLNVTFTITDDKNKNMKIFASFFWKKKDGEKNDFSISQFTSLLDASGAGRKLNSYQDLVGKEVTLNTRYDNQSGRSEIRGYKKVVQKSSNDDI